MNDNQSHKQQRVARKQLLRLFILEMGVGVLIVAFDSAFVKYDGARYRDASFYVTVPLIGLNLGYLGRLRLTKAIHIRARARLAGTLIGGLLLGAGLAYEVISRLST